MFRIQHMMANGSGMTGIALCNDPCFSSTCKISYLGLRWSGSFGGCSIFLVSFLGALLGVMVMLGGSLCAFGSSLLTSFRLLVSGTSSAPESEVTVISIFSCSFEFVLVMVNA